MGVARGWGRWEWSLSLNGYSFNVGGEKVLEMDDVMVV